MSTMTEAVIERPAAIDEVEEMKSQLGDQRVLLHNISWETYERLLADDVRQVQIFKLEGKSYVECENSLSFPWLTSAMLTNFLDQCRSVGQDAAIRAFRDWLRKEKAKLQA